MVVSVLPVGKRIKSATINIIWSYRLTVRTPGFHPGNPGSIPGTITKVKHPSNDGCFTLVPSAGRTRRGSTTVKSWILQWVADGRARIAIPSKRWTGEITIEMSGAFSFAGAARRKRTP